jgi:hypothetical protein
MWKDVAIVAVSAGLGEWGARKFAGPIEAKAIELKIPAALAHAGVVGGAAAIGYLVVKQFV